MFTQVCRCLQRGSSSSSAFRCSFQVSTPLKRFFPTLSRLGVAAAAQREKRRRRRRRRGMGRRILSEALRTIVNAERRGRATAQLQPISNVMVAFLRVMKDRGYIKDFQVFDPQRVGKITVELQGRITDCRALMHRQDIKAREIEECTMHTLPTRQWGYVVITTPNGILDHEEAIKQNVGGQVLGYFH